MLSDELSEASYCNVLVIPHRRAISFICNLRTQQNMRFNLLKLSYTVMFLVCE